METEEIIISNKKWMRLTIILGVLFFSFLGFFIILQAVINAPSHFAQSILYAVIGLFILFVVIKGFPLLRFLSHTLQFNEKGIEIKKGNLSNKYSWDEISDIKQSDTFQVLRIYDSSGKIIYAVDYYATNFYEFLWAISDDSQSPIDKSKPGYWNR